MNNVLVAYFSHKGENYFNGNIKNISKGNTEIIAEMIQDNLGCDIFEIKSAKDYPINYRQCVDVAREENNKNIYPELKEDLDDLNSYDTIILGYPNWCGTMPMVVFSFLSKHDLKNKTIIPFCTNEGSGMGTSENDLKRLCKDSKIVKGLAIHGSEVNNSRGLIDNWLQKMKGSL